MGFPGGVTSQSPGPASDQILSIKADIVASKVLRLRAKALGKYRSKYFAPFINGIYAGQNILAPLNGDIQGSFLLTEGTQVGSLYLEDAGQWPSFDDYIPVGMAETAEALTARRILISWTAPYTLTSVRGDTQISGITITGAVRGTNVSRHDTLSTRGVLTYSITLFGTYRIVRWWAGSVLVAEGSRNGDGALTCSAMNGSGLAVACTIAYTGEVDPSTAYVELRWPKSYQIHYSTSALAYPRTPEDTITDNQSNAFLYLTPVLSGGTYNYNVLTVDDDGVVQTAGLPVTTAQTLNTAPSAPTITSVTGTAAAATVNWTVGEAGCTFTVYTSLINEPVNFGNYATPAPIVTALNATSQVLAAVTGYAATSNQAAIDTLFNAFDTALAALSTAIGGTQAAFAASFSANVLTAGRSAISAYGDSVNITTFRHLDAFTVLSNGLLEYHNSLPSGMVAADWALAMSPVAGHYMASCGELLNKTPGRYTFANGAIGAGGTTAASDIGTGASSDGTSGLALAKVATSLYELGLPITNTGKIRIVVRATKATVQETTDTEYEVEFDNAGAIVAARPNPAHIQTITATSGLTVSVSASILTDDANAAASVIDLYVVALASSIVLTSPQATSSALTENFNLQNATINYTVAGAGWYRVAVVGRSAAGVRSATYKESLIYLDSTAPGGVTNISAKVIRGRGATNG